MALAAPALAEAGCRFLPLGAWRRHARYFIVRPRSRPRLRLFPRTSSRRPALLLATALTVVGASLPVRAEAPFTLAGTPGQLP